MVETKKGVLPVKGSLQQSLHLLEIEFYVVNRSKNFLGQTWSPSVVGDRARFKTLVSSPSSSQKKQKKNLNNITKLQQIYVLHYCVELYTNAEK